jgi:hypothetical protein
MMEAAMLDDADMADRTPPGRRYLMIATLIVWALVVVAGALIGGHPMVAAIVLALVVVAAVLAVRIAEIAFGLLSVIAGGAWILFWGVLTLHWGLGFGTEQWFGGAVVELEVDLWRLAIYGALTSLGLIPLSLGVCFIFGVGPLAKPVKEPDQLNEGPSRRSVLAASVEVALVVAILVFAAFVVRTEFSGDSYDYASSVSNAPGGS